ncbi:hypothetical protein CEXT_346431 [Caerostris extrusa]|uniref:Uncharacterized protein n=1 Tax=Caerostris extrusa TaxID=172846 RepID=A0AAV4VNB2_CAEEX|nr:hypothetical protein CEXT_346431 [Caerostris extrusa]
MERDATMDYSDRGSTPGASNPELTAQKLYDAYAAALTRHSPDDDDLKEIKILHDDFQHAMREVSKLELCPLPFVKNIKLTTLTVKLSAMLSILTIPEHDNDGFTMPSKKFIAKINYAKYPQQLVETKNSFHKLNVNEQEEHDSDTIPVVKKCHPLRSSQLKI